ncbi:hypothetical protein FGADI_12632 [Fusarium gaditjirri]|uniref:Uncharacterized protein n=1 Tax=Fusarium gaditjirri TaxID=282569 RepID=A0A8H4SRK4_9HYPO|nr:hypothetical protein FGADI_12632 [Fusarium gaditjirri]
MVASELSNERIAEIQKAVGKPWTMSPDEYMARLKRETGSEDMLDQFLQKACKLDRELQRPSAEERLKQLTAVDFTDVAAISKHHFALTIDMVGRFDLGTDGEDAFAIATNSEALWTEEFLCSPSTSRSTDPDDRFAHPALISLNKGEVSRSHLGSEPSNTGTVTASAKPLPSLVMPIGQLQKKPKAKTNDFFLDTDYVLVIDAVTTSNPVWLIYDRNAQDDLGERRIVHPDKQPLVFKGLRKNLDAMQVFSSVQQWLDSYGNLDFAQMQKAMQETSITGPVKAQEIAISETDKLFCQ